jgi:hypothetical protein
MIPIHLLVALGIMTTIQSVKSRYRSMLVFGLFFFFALNVFYFMHELFVHQPIHAPIYRNAPDKALAIALKDVYLSYDVVVSQKILPHILFFWPVDPANYQKEGSPRDTDNARYRNFLFVSDACPSQLSDPAVVALRVARILYVDSAACALAKNDVIIKTITYKNTLGAYYLIEKRKP